MPTKLKKKSSNFVLEFDEKKREEYLTGFSRRKNERKKIAKLELKELIKNKKKEIKKKKNDENLLNYHSLEKLSSPKSQILNINNDSVTITHLDNMMTDNQQWLGINNEFYSNISEDKSNEAHSSSKDHKNFKKMLKNKRIHSKLNNRKFKKNTNMTQNKHKNNRLKKRRKK